MNTTVRSKNGNITRLQRGGLVDKMHGGFGLVDNLFMTYEGNLLTSVRDNASRHSYAGATDFDGVAKQEYPLTYNDAGSLVSDAGRKIAKIDYDYRNNPARIQFTNGNETRYVYSATGEKLSVRYYVAKPNVTRKFGVKPEGSTQEQVMAVSQNDYVLGGKLRLQNGMINHVFFEGGYAKATPVSSITYDFAFFYYNQDHLGNNREVVNASGNVQQITNYYPFGAPYADPKAVKGSALQPYKYNGKELDTMHGLNTYDYGARQYDPILCRMDKIDRFCEKDYSHNPYTYCMDNPIRSIDVNGDSCIVLLAPDGANGYGHMAIGIQNSKGEWCLYSKNGTNQNFGTYGKEPPIGDKKHNDRGEKKADNLYDFLHAPSINPIDDNNKPEYTEGFLIATTPKQDERMKEGALSVINHDYDVLSSNCAQTVQRALKYGGLNPGNGLKPKATVYPSIVKNNKGAKILIYNPQLSPRKW